MWYPETKGFIVVSTNPRILDLIYNVIATFKSVLKKD